MEKNWLAQIQWNTDGLIPVIVQEQGSKDVLMMAWMNSDTLLETIALGQAIYWSRSRKKRWHKGEESGHFQNVQGVYLDCDGDTLLLVVEQVGAIACHTGAHSCFFQELESTSLPFGWKELSGVRK